jgi:hypothetical protein
VSYSVLIHLRTDRGATLLFNFKTRISCKCLSERRLPVVNSEMRRPPEPGFPVPRARFGATSIAFICQSDHQQIKNGDHDARDHNRVKITALLYGFNQSRRIFRVDHFTREHFLAKPRQDRTP